jgi:hypothetical protein
MRVYGPNNLGRIMSAKTVEIEQLKMIESKLR